jgi:hypothetical protein
LQYCGNGPTAEACAAAEAAAAANGAPPAAAAAAAAAVAADAAAAAATGWVFVDATIAQAFMLAPSSGGGVYVSVRFAVHDTLSCSGFFAKPLEKEIEFVVECPCSEIPPKVSVDFEIKPESLENVKKTSIESIPKFSIRGKLRSINCPLNAPFTGELTVVESATRIRSIELQLVRVETIISGSQVAKESTEIQNLQVGDGNVCKNLAIRLYMVFPRVFTCPTIITDSFRVEFEVNIIVVFE